jgi:hypothetical protein
MLVFSDTMYSVVLSSHRCFEIFFTDRVLKLDPYSRGGIGFFRMEYLELWDGTQNYHKFLRKADGVEAMVNA